MAAIIPNTPGTGNNIPTSTYIASITESYPNVNRQRVVESSINSKETIDFLPVNMGLNAQLADKYLEYRINGVAGSFLDLSSIFMQLHIKLTDTATGAPLGDEVTTGLVNGLSNTLFKSVSVFLNEKLVEANAFFNYSSYIKLLKKMNKQQISRYGPCGHLYDDCNTLGVTQTYTDPIFTTQTSNIEHKLMSGIKANGVYLCFPLLLELSSLDMYLLDGVDVRIRLELANQNWIVNSSTADADISLNISKAALWIDRVIPHYNAMSALNTGLESKPLEYIFNKTLHKTYVIGTGQSGIMIDQPFANCIPEDLTFVLVEMGTMAGQLNRNPLYFKHCNMSNIHITINGSTVYNLNTDFDVVNFSHLFYEAQKSMGMDVENMISYDSFTRGRSIFSFNFVNEVIEDTLPVERSASLRLSLSFKNPLTSPHVVILMAGTKGIITIDRQRIITCDVRG